MFGGRVSALAQRCRFFQNGKPWAVIAGAGPQSLPDNYALRRFVGDK